MTANQKPRFENNLSTSFICPECNDGTHLRIKTNNANGGQFLGCPNWPECVYTRPIPESWVMRAQGQEELL
jgi:ssDNA-binding Zn-finger/Zn-ribbon topoisomerase 1